MKDLYIAILLLLWMIFTIGLTLSVIGLFIVAPKNNDTYNYKTQEEMRSTWMRIGYGLYERLIK